LVLPAITLRGEVLSESVPAAEFLIRRDGKPGKPEVTLSPLRYYCQHQAQIEAVEQGDHRLTLSSNLGEPVAPGTKGHFLTVARADADRVEVHHGAVASDVTLPVVEVAE